MPFGAPNQIPGSRNCSQLTDAYPLMRSLGAGDRRSDRGSPPIRRLSNSVHEFRANSQR